MQIKETRCGPLDGDTLGRRGIVLYVTASAPYGSGEFWALDEVTNLIGAGAEVRIVPRSMGRAPLHLAGRELMSNTVAVPLVSLRGMAWVIAAIRHPRRVANCVVWAARWVQSPWDVLKAVIVLPKAFRVARVLRGANVAHVHAQAATTVGVVARTVSVVCGCPFSFTIHTAERLVDKRRQWLRHLLSHAAFVRCVSAGVADRVRELVGPALAEKVHVVHLGVRVAAAHSGAQRDDDVLRIATPAALIEHKGHDVAISACTLLLKRGLTRLRWSFFGSGPLRRKLEAQVRRCGLQSTILFAGSIPNDRLVQLYARREVDVVVLPSVPRAGKMEGIPHALMQAMAYGIPTISTTSGDTLELVGNRAGISVAPNDPVALADAVQLLADPAKRAHYAEQGRAKIALAFNEEKTTRSLLRLFFSPDKAEGSACP